MERKNKEGVLGLLDFAWSVWLGRKWNKLRKESLMDEAIEIG
jgi:hypothetical protein